MTQHYLDESMAEDLGSLPDLETFHAGEGELELEGLEEGETSGEGWYYWFCFPGCMPESEPFGPYATEAEALADAREIHLG